MLQDVQQTRLERAVDWLIRWRSGLLVVAIVLAAVAWPVATRLAFDQTLESLYAEEDPHLQDFLASRSAFGGDEFLIVAYPEPELFEPDSNRLTEGAVERIRQFADKLNEVPGVLPESTQDLARALRFPYGREKIREISSGTLNSLDGKTTAIVLRLMPAQESPISRGETIARVRKVAAEHNPPAMVVGEPAQIHDMFRYVEDDGRKLFVVSLALLSIVLLVLLQRVRWVVLPVLVVVISIVWTEAALVLSGMRLSMVSSMLNSLMTIIGVQTAMHVSLTFREQHRTMLPAVALKESMVELAAPVWWAVATTSFGFGVLCCSHINPVASFGIMMAIGSLVVLVAVVMLLPGCVLIGRLDPEPPPTAADRRVAAFLGRITLWVEHHPRKVALASVALVGFTAIGFRWLRVETDFSKNFRANSDIVRSLEFVENRLGGAGSWEVNFPAPAEVTDEYIDKVRNLAIRLRDEFGISADAGTSAEPIEHAGRLSKVIVITDALDLIKLPFVTLSTETKLTMLGALQPEFIASVYNREARRMRILLRAYERQPAETKLNLITEVERVARETFPETNVVTGQPAASANPKRDDRPHSTGLFVLLTFLIESLLSDQWTSSWLATVGITTMMWVAFRSLPIGLMSLIPNLVPNVLVIGMMGWIGLPVNIATAMIACVSMGLTVDSSIIYLDGYQRARTRGLRVHEALHETHRDVGRALVYSNVALMAGFSVLALSHFIPLVYFGLLVSLAMLGGLIGNLVFLPLLIGWWDGRKEHHQPNAAASAG